MAPFIVQMVNSHYGISFLKNYRLPYEVPLLSFQVLVHSGPSVMFLLHLPPTLTPSGPHSLSRQAEVLKPSLTCPKPLLDNLKSPSSEWK